MKVDTTILESLLGQARKAVIVGHLNPDGDAIGSTIAAYHFLRSMDIDSTIILPSVFPSSFKFLCPKDKPILVYEIEKEASLRAIEQADTMVCLDFNRFSRTDALEAPLSQSKARKILIDHHLDPDTQAFDLVISKTDISSASELLFWTLMNTKKIAGRVGNLSMESANALYTGMMTDTNNFSNSCYPSTFEMASKLLSRGVNKTRLQEKVMQCYTLPRTKLMGHLLKDNLTYFKEYHASCMTLSIKEKKAHSFKPGDSEGFVNLPLAAKSVRISALFTENNDGKFIRVSLRSKGKIDVNRLSRMFFNGGGHRNASGGRLYMKLEDVPAYYKDALGKFFGTIYE